MGHSLVVFDKDLVLERRDLGNLDLELFGRSLPVVYAGVFASAKGQLAVSGVLTFQPLLHQLLLAQEISVSRSCVAAAISLDSSEVELLVHTRSGFEQVERTMLATYHPILELARVNSVPPLVWVAAGSEYTNALELEKSGEPQIVDVALPKGLVEAPPKHMECERLGTKPDFPCGEGKHEPSNQDEDLSWCVSVQDREEASEEHMRDVEHTGSSSRGCCSSITVGKRDEAEGFGPS